MLKTKVNLIHQKKNENLIKNALTVCVLALLNFAAAQSRLCGYLSFVNVSIAASSGNLGVFSFVVSAATYLLTGNFKNASVQLCAMVIILVIKLLSGSRITPVRNAAITASALLFCSLLASLIVRTPTSLFLYRIVFSLLCGCLTYLIDKMKKQAQSLSAIELSGINSAAVGIIYVLLVATLCSVNILSLNIGRCVGILAIFFAAKRYSLAGGAVCGALTTFSVMLYYPEIAKNALVLTACGLLCGALSGFGNIAMTVGFAFSSVLGLAVVGFNSDTFSMLTDIGVSAVFFAVLPKEAENKLMSFFMNNKSGKTENQSISSQLDFASKTVMGVRKRLEDISDAISKNVSAQSCSKLVKEELCESCENRSACQGESSKSYERAFKNAENSLKKGEQPDIGDFYFCKKQSEISSRLESAHNRLACEQASVRKTNDMRRLLSEQLYVTEKMLDDLSADFLKMSRTDAFLTEKVNRLLLKYGFSRATAGVYYDDHNSKRVEIYSPKELDCDMVKLTVDISTALDCDLEMPAVSKAEGMTKAVFCQAPVYKLSSSAVQFSAKDGDCCGDTLERIWLSACEYVIILSDGMGTGKKARLDSSFTTGMVTRFLAAGLSVETSLGIINSILRVKGWDESFATADIGYFDLCSGKVRFIKAGASASYILRDGSVIKVEGQSFPLGILNKTSPLSAEYQLYDGDRVILTSDGVNEGSVKKSIPEIVRNDLTVKQAAEMIALMEKNGETKTLKDDISVCVADVFMR